MKKQYDVAPMTDRQFNDFCKRQDSNNEEWSRALFANLLQVSNGKSNTQQVNRSLNLETTRFKNGNLKQQGQAIKAYLLHVIDAHNIGIEWKNDRFQYVQSNALDIDQVIPYHVWQAEAEAKAKAEAEAKAATKAEAEAQASQLKLEKAEAAKAAKAATKAAEAEALSLAKVEAVKAAEAEAEAEGLDKALKAERDRLIAAGGGVQAKSLLAQLERALLAGVTGGSVTDLLSIAKAAGELQIMATGLAMDAKAKVDGDAAGQLADIKPSAKSRSAGLKIA